jgi:hypothetical protein
MTMAHTLHDILIGSYADHCEKWDADGLSPEDVERLHGKEAERAYMNYLYLNIKWRASRFHRMPQRKWGGVWL